MRTALFIGAVILIVLAVPALLKVDSRLRAGRRWSAALEAGRTVLAIGAAAGLLTVLARTR